MLDGACSLVGDEMLVGAYGGGLAGVETSTFCAGSDCCCEAGGGELGRVSVN